MTTLAAETPSTSVHDAAEDRVQKAPARDSVSGAERRRVTMWIALMTFVIGTAAAHVLDIDALYTLYSGRAVSVGLPHHEQFAAAAHNVWLDQQWLAQWMVYRIFAVAGYAGVTLWVAAMLALTAALLMAVMLRRGASTGIAARWTMAGVAVLFVTPIVRAQTFAFPLFAALLLIALPDQLGRCAWRRQLSAVPLLVLWANLHGSVLLGVAVAVVLCLGNAVARRSGRQDLAKHLALSVVFAATPLATPYGLSIVHYYSSLIGNPTLRASATEWRPASLSNPACWPYFALLAVALVALARAYWRRTSRPSALEVPLAIALASLGIYAVRYMFWGAMVVAVLAAANATPTRRRRPRLPAMFVWVVVGTISAAAVVSVTRSSTPSYLHQLPVRLAAVAARVADEHPGAVVLADQRTSGVLLWLHPELRRRVAFDVRFEQYSRRTLARYFAYLRDDDPGFACPYAIVAVSRAERPQLAAAITADDDWQKHYVGRYGVVAVRSHACG